MKKIPRTLALFALCLLLPAARAQAAHPDASAAATPTQNAERFQQLHQSFLERGKAGPIGVLFIGDSIVNHWRIAPAIWDKYYGSYQPANFGIPGDTTQNVIWRIEHGELDGLHPRAVVFMLGTNNTGSNTADEIFAADRKIVGLIRAKIPETKVLLLGIFPRGARKGPDYKKRMAIITAVNRQLAALDDGDHVRYLDLGPSFLAADGTIPAATMADGVHPTVAGFQIWADAMQPRLLEVLNSPVYRFQFGAGAVAPGYTQVLPDMAYTKERGFGFEPGAQVVSVDRAGTPAAGTDPLHQHFITGDKPFYFSTHLPEEGNYRVTVTLGDPAGESTTTIKAELRRLMVERLHTDAGQFATVSFIVNTRTPKIYAVGDIKAGQVQLKAPRENGLEAWDWDDLLTLEFNNARPALCALEITRVDVPTVFIIGDSTVCDQPREPFNSWGQMLPNFLQPDIAVANHGESGETYRASISRRRLDKMLSLMKPGDYMIMQFGHNDQKQIKPGTGGPFTTYKAEIKVHVDAVRAHGGIPVIVSPMERRNYNADGSFKPTLADYAEGARQAAKELNVAFIDLNAKSIQFYQALGRDKAYLAFAGHGLTRDATHHDNYGSYELAKIIVQGIRDDNLSLAAHIKPDFAGFDPSHPDPVDTFALPASPQFTNQRPLGD